MSITAQSNYCPLFYKGLHITENHNNISVGHCCISTLGPRTEKIDFDSNNFLVHNRNSWATEKVSGCQSCWNNEANNQTSQRLFNIDKFKDIGNPVTTELVNLDYSVGKLCNAKCIICNSNVSSTWAAEDYKFSNAKPVGKIFNATENSRVQNLNLSKLRWLYFTGGEALMTNAPTDILNLIKLQQGSLANISFQTSTNGSIRPSPELVALWQDCQDVTLFASIDATADAFEYIRNPLEWEQVKNNLDFILDIGPNINIHISVTLGLHNIDELEKTYQWYLSKSWDQEKNQFTLHNCYGTYALSNASHQMLDIWKTKISAMNYPWRDQVLNMLNVPGKNNTVWLNHLKQMDFRRNRDWTNDLTGLNETYTRTL